jgi:protein-disulfide isomerase
MAAVAAAATAGGALPVLAKDGDHIDLVKLMAPKGIPDKVLGNAQAKVTMIEYASPTCPHCAAFSNDVFPVFKSQYVDSGKVAYIMRPFARNIQDAAIFMVAEAAAMATDAGTAPGADGAAATGLPTKPYSQQAIETYINVISTYFRTQNDWGLSDKPHDALLNVATQLGFSAQSFDAALTNQPLLQAINDMRDQALNDFGVDGTPTFYINGLQMSGEQSMDALGKIIDPLLV